MNKLFKGIGKIFKSIGKFIDKKIILPITKVFVSLSKKFNTNGRGFEKIITRKSGLIVVSLIAALGIFFVADSKSTSLIETSAEVLYDQPITAKYNEAAYVIDGLPETVDITLIGRRSDVYLAKQLPTNDIEVDLTDYKPGVHKVQLKYKKALSSVEYKLDPSVATVVIYEKVSEEKEVNYEVINKSKIDSKLMVESVSLSTENVYVKGNEAMLNEVASVKAVVDLKNLTYQKTGEQTLKDVKLVAYNSLGDKVNVEIAPSTVSATVNITSPHKEVPVKVIPKNYDKILFGKAISSITTDINKVTIYGSSEKLDSITYLPIYVDVNNLKASKKYSITLSKPKGVRAISETSAIVTVNLGTSTSKQIDDIYLEYENLQDGLTVQAVDESSTKISVIVKGVSDVINDIDPSTIKAYLNLNNLNEGVHEVEVKVTGTDLKAKYEPKTLKVKLKIAKSVKK